MKSECILELLRTKTEITDLLGAGENLRVYPNRAPQDEQTPYVTFRRLITNPVNSFSGASSYDHAHYDFFFHGPDAHELETLKDAFRGAFEGSKGTYAGIEVDYVEFVDEQDSFADGTDFYEITQEYSLKHRR